MAFGLQRKRGECHRTPQEWDAEVNPALMEACPRLPTLISLHFNNTLVFSGILQHKRRWARLSVTVAHRMCNSDSFPSLDTLLAVECWRGRGETLTPSLLEVFFCFHNQLYGLLS